MYKESVDNICSLFTFFLHEYLSECDIIMENLFQKPLFCLVRKKNVSDNRVKIYGTISYMYWNPIKSILTGIFCGVIKTFLFSSLVPWIQMEKWRLGTLAVFNKVSRSGIFTQVKITLCNCVAINFCYKVLKIVKDCGQLRDLLSIK